MYPKYKCFGCGHIWWSGEILAICPVCRGKGVKMKEGETKRMNYYKCEGCGTLFSGFSLSKKCKCGEKIKEISKEEYEEEKKRKLNDSDFRGKLKGGFYN